LLLESYSIETKLVTLHLEYDVVSLQGEPTAIGRFGRVVADNLMKDPPRPYQFLIPGDVAPSLRSTVQSFKRMLSDDLGVPSDRVRYCEFRSTDVPLLVGTCLYRLDIEALKEREPVLWLALDGYVKSDGWLCYSIHYNAETKGEIMLESQQIARTLRTFTSMWRNGKSDW